jgi:hypothetical protein
MATFAQAITTVSSTAVASSHGSATGMLLPAGVPSSPDTLRDCCRSAAGKPAA